MAIESERGGLHSPCECGECSMVTHTKASHLNTPGLYWQGNTYADSESDIIN